MNYLNKNICALNICLLVIFSMPATGKTRVEMPEELQGIYQPDRKACLSAIASYKEDNNNHPYLLIKKDSIIFNTIVACKPTKVTGGSGVYKVSSICHDDDGKSKSLNTYTLKNNILTDQTKNGRLFYARCGPL